MIETMQWDRLRPIGLTHALAQAIALIGEPGSPMRVTEVHRDSVVVDDGETENDARVHPGLLRALATADDALAVGDWVIAQRDATGGLWLQARVPPTTQLARRNAAGARQVIASNVDTALLVMGLDGDFNLRRLERYLALTGSADVRPVVVLTKADLVADADDRLAAVRARAGSHIAVHAVNALDPQTAVALAPYLAPGCTLIVLGSSGAGKSTLTNTLAGVSVQPTGAVRNDSRGRHTTTARSLHRLPAGACLIDTPGLRGLRADADEGALAATFADIATLAGECRFRDCRHRGEPGCAVRAAVPAERLANFHKMTRELQRETLTPLQRKEVLAGWKARHRAATERMKLKRG